jgi:hypothetical protein
VCDVQRGDIVKGRSLELYFIAGKPDGMLTAVLFNWAGHVLTSTRTQIAEATARKAAHYTGVYGMPVWQATVPVCRAFLNYALKRLGLDTAPAAWLRQDQKTILLRREADV